MTTTEVTIIHDRRVNHVLHLLLSVFTGGLWLPVWIVLAFRGRKGT